MVVSAKAALKMKEEGKKKKEKKILDKGYMYGTSLSLGKFGVIKNKFRANA